MYLAKFCGFDYFIQKAIFRLNVDTIANATLATASFPCNDLSLAGERRGLGAGHSSTFWGFINVLEELGPRRPLLILLDNTINIIDRRRTAWYEWEPRLWHGTFLLSVIDVVVRTKVPLLFSPDCPHLNR